jgi:TFIIF-interacting CTD phosphatase-like protein
MEDVIIIDNSPNSYAFHTENALPILSWYADTSDTALYQLLPVLQKLSKVDDVRSFLPKIVSQNKVNFK